MVFHWAQAASNHTFSSGLSLERRSVATLTLLDDHKIEASSSSSIDYPHKWKRTPDELPPFDIAEFMRAKKVTPAFSTDFAYEVELEKGALVLKEGGRSVELLSKREVQKQIPALAEETREARVLPTAQILDAHHGAPTETWFYTVQIGSASWDADWLELLLAVPGQRVHDARGRR
jgi:hypothetical protein